VPGSVDRSRDSVAQQFRASDQVIGCKGTDDRVISEALAHNVGRQANRGHGVTPGGFDEERALIGGSELGQLGEDTLAMSSTGHDRHG